MAPNYLTAKLDLVMIGYRINYGPLGILYVLFLDVIPEAII